MLKAVLFDFFDTLALIRQGEVFYEPALKKLHASLAKNSIRVPFDSFTRTYFKVRDRLYAETSGNLREPHFSLRVSLALKKFGYEYDTFDPIIATATSAFADVFMNYVELDVEAVPLLARLQPIYKLGVISNFALPECLRTLVQSFGLNRFFDVVIISADYDRRKPDPLIFRKALESLNVEAADAVFVGDTPKTDVKGARNVGMKSILMEKKHFAVDGEALLYVQSEDDANTKPDYAVDHLLSVADVLGKC